MSRWRRTCCRELLRNSRPSCLCPPSSALATGFVFRKHTDQGGRGEMSELAAGFPAGSSSAPTLCTGDFFSKRWDSKECLQRVVSAVSWTSRLGADGFHLGGLLMAVCRKQSGRWCGGGDLSVSALGCSLLPQPIPQGSGGSLSRNLGGRWDSGSWSVEDTKALLLWEKPSCLQSLC